MGKEKREEEPGRKRWGEAVKREEGGELTMNKTGNTSVGGRRKLGKREGWGMEWGMRWDGKGDGKGDGEGRSNMILKLEILLRRKRIIEN